MKEYPKFPKFTEWKGSYTRIFTSNTTIPSDADLKEMYESEKEWYREYKLKNKHR